MKPRVCPVCGYCDNTGRGPILAALLDMTNTWVRARCHCPNCDSLWEERTDRFGPDQIIVTRIGQERKTA